jgi:hypothetical protein
MCLVFLSNAQTYLSALPDLVHILLVGRRDVPTGIQLALNPADGQRTRNFVGLVL